MKVLLHACCGPCTIKPAHILRDEGFEVVLAFVNPNIQPLIEYDRRLETFKTYCSAEGFEYREFGWDTDGWERTVAPLGMRHEARCRMCYRLRFKAVAYYAAQQGFDAISTTLSVSPYQDYETIKAELERAALPYELAVLARDFTEFYQEATDISRELGMYRQDYCGCRFSAAEAAFERTQRKQERRSSQKVRSAMRRLLTKEEVEKRL